MSDKALSPMLPDRDYAIGICNRAVYYARGWEIAISRNIAQLNKTRIVCEINSTIEDLEMLRSYIESLEG